MITSANFDSYVRAYPLEPSDVAPPPQEASDFLETDYKEHAPIPPSPSIDLFTACGYTISSKHELFKRIDASHIQGIVTKIDLIKLTDRQIKILKEGPYYHGSNSFFCQENFFDYVLKAFLTSNITEKRLHLLALYWGCLEVTEQDDECTYECYQLFDTNNNESAKDAQNIFFLSFFEPLGISKDAFFSSIEQLQKTEDPIDTQFFVLQRSPTFQEELYQVFIHLAKKDKLNQWVMTSTLASNFSQVILPPHLIDFVLRAKFGHHITPLIPSFGFNPKEPLSKGYRPFYLPSPKDVGLYALPPKIDSLLYKAQLTITRHDVYHAVIDSANFHKSTWASLALYVKTRTDLFPDDAIQQQVFEILLDRECHAYVYSQNDPNFAFWQAAYSRIGSIINKTNAQVTIELITQFFAEFYIHAKLSEVPIAINQPDILTRLKGPPEVQALGQQILSKIWALIENQTAAATTSISNEHS